ncbi:MAG: hypothetical protein AAF667_07340 [Pseudomonadota bacterium]
MGAWGPGLFQSDYTADLKEDVRDRLGVANLRGESLETVVESLRSSAGAETAPTDADSASFWIALADILHGYGLEHPPVFSKAKEIIDSGTDLRLLEELDMSATDLRKRKAILDALPSKWATPHDKPRKVPELKQDDYILEQGAIFSYPTMDGNPYQEPIGTEAKRAYRFEPDAQNAFVCINRARVHFDLEARYFIVPLALQLQFGTPDLEACMEACFVMHANLYHRSFEPLGGWREVKRSDLKTMKAKPIGHFIPDLGRFEALFGDRVHAPPSRWAEMGDPLWMNSGYRAEQARGHIWVEFGELPPVLSDFIDPAAGRGAAR